MAIAPNFALWAFVSGSIGLLSAALMWLVLPEWLAAVVRRLWLADAIAATVALAVTIAIAIAIAGHIDSEVTRAEKAQRAYSENGSRNLHAVFPKLSVCQRHRSECNHRALARVSI